ncbi:hypothetical protein GX48_01921 [Paracoccidioides brasiliensis]|nr:hypothetical protein GX48_01921 [Paracoccidioides brasiliensis]
MANVSKKCKSPGPSSSHTLDHYDSPAPRTPTGSPTRKRLKITHNQKQALIDNLQLEITERARKLRAQYALQAQDLRGRIERRINRIPMALRKANIGELLAKHSESTNADDAVKMSKATAKSSKATATSETGNATVSTTRTTRGVKRTSDVMLASDKENAPFQDPVHVPLSNPKKRGTPNAHPGHPRVLSQFTETGVLSPKSSNSRTFPQSPLRNVTGKSQQHLSNLRPSSPLKAASCMKSAGPGFTAMVENASTRATRGAAGAGTRKVSPNSDATGTRRKTTAKSTASTTTTRAPPSRPTTRQRNTRRNSADSTASNTSSGTTVVKMMRRGTAGSQKASAATSKRAAVPRGQAPTATSTAKKASAAAAKTLETTESAGTRKRVLRKRS